MVKRKPFCLATLLMVCVFNAANAGDFEKLRLGLVSGVGVSGSQTATHSMGSTMGIFVNFALSQRFFLEMEVEKTHPRASGTCTAGDGSCFFENMHDRDWSTRLALNYHFRSVSRAISPFVGIGTGNYYIQNSKRRIKQAQRQVGGETVDYDLRRSFKRPGFFATMGMRWRANHRTSIYLQTKSLVLFDRENDLVVGPTSKFTDLLNVSASVRFNLN